MDNWHVLALMEGASKSSRGGVGDKRTKPGVMVESQGDCTGAMLGDKGAQGARPDMLLYVGIFCTVARAMHK